VRYVLEGSVRKVANRVRMTGQLIDAESGAHIWADRFESALDEKTLAIPDRLGNHRLDTFENLLRVSGTGRIVRDRFLQSRLAVNGKEPNLLLIVTVEEAFMHCPKCVIRSRLWNPEQWPNRSDVPSLAEAIVVHANSSETVAEVQAVIDDGIARLY
jgi:uncharacterized protein